jgi:hypothetical protein
MLRADQDTDDVAEPVQPVRRVRTSRAERLWPMAIVALVVAFNLWILRGERIPVQSGNDSEIHRNMLQWAVDRVQDGHLPFDGWFPDFALGFPQFHQYQSLPHIVTTPIAAVFGVDTTYFWALYLLLALWPVCIYASLRLFGLSRWTAAGAAVVSPLVSTAGAFGLTNFGYEFGSYIWQGHGLWAQLFAMWLLPLSLALTWRAVARNGSVTAAAVVTGATIACHFITGYLALVAVGLWLVIVPTRIPQRLLRTAVVVVGSLVAILWVVVPLFADRAYAVYSGYERGSFWYDSYGARDVLDWLVTGELLDHGRFIPVVTILAGIGLVVSVVRARRDEASRALLAFFVASLLLTFGRATFGAVADLLPEAHSLFFPRFVMGVQLGGVFLAGIGVAWLGTSAVAIARARAPRARQAVVAAVVVVVLLALLFPAWSERYRYASDSGELAEQQREADAEQGDDLVALAKMTEQQPGRIYSGIATADGRNVAIGFVPIYSELINRGYDTFGDFLRVSSLSAALEPLFYPSAAQLDLNGVRWVILPKGVRAPRASRRVATRGNLELRRVDGATGYLQVIDTVGPAIEADNENLARKMKPLLHGEHLGNRRLPTVAFDGEPAASPTLRRGEDPTGFAGTVLQESVALDDGRFRGVVDARRPAVVIVKGSYHPRWRASVDGKPVDTEFIAPSFVGVKVPPGEHLVQFWYKSYPSYFWLFLLSGLGVGGLVAFDVFARRARRRADAASHVDPWDDGRPPDPNGGIDDPQAVPVRQAAG